MKYTIASSALLALAQAGCHNMSWGYTDQTGDDCAWYESYPDTCGSYDTDNFFAERMCCVCGGGVTHDVQACTDTDNGLTDTWGDNCTWYNENPTGCGNYDTDSF